MAQLLLLAGRALALGGGWAGSCRRGPFSPLRWLRGWPGMLTLLLTPGGVVWRGCAVGFVLVWRLVGVGWGPAVAPCWVVPRSVVMGSWLEWGSPVLGRSFAIV